MIDPPLLIAVIIWTIIIVVAIVIVCTLSKAYNCCKTKRPMENYDEIYDDVTI